ncbi:MAG: aldo/keto reductase [Caulobacterales bacterium]
MSARILDDATTGTIKIGDISVRRLGFGAMRISSARNAEGKLDRAEAVKLTKRVYERGVNFFDAANIYGYGACEEIIAEALHPYPKDVLIASKAGFATIEMTKEMRSLPPDGNPRRIREETEKSLRRLRVDCIDLHQSHVPDPAYPYADTIGAFAELQKEGKIRHVGVSNVSLEQLRIAQSVVKVVSVQNRYNVGSRDSEDVLAACEKEGIAFLPYRPVGLRNTPADNLIAELAQKHHAATQQVALVWLLKHSPVMLPIPGTSNIHHLDENIDAAWLSISDAEIAALDAAAAPQEGKKAASPFS